MEDAAESLAESMEKKVEAVTQRVTGAPRPHVYYELWNEPLMSVGPESWVNELIYLAGGKNIFAGAATKFPLVNSEVVIEVNPQIIICPSHGAYVDAPKEIKARPGWNVIDAVRNDKIYAVEGDLLMRPGPRIVMGLEMLAEAIHPELFGEE